MSRFFVGFALWILLLAACGGDKGSSNPVASTDSLASPCKTETKDNCEYGTLTDDRDGRTYKTVKIGEQWWMAENLNYVTEAGSCCYNDSAEYCEKYGRFYRWTAAVGKSEKGCGFGWNCDLGDGKVRGVCPEGWHLPDTTEWKALFDAVGGDSTAGIMLKSTEGWINNGNGSDSFEFSALPAGFRYDGYFYHEGNFAYFWSSTEHDRSYAYFMFLDANIGKGYLNDYSKYNAFSVRCIKD